MAHRATEGTHPLLTATLLLAAVKDMIGADTVGDRRQTERAFGLATEMARQLQQRSGIELEQIIDVAVGHARKNWPAARLLEYLGIH